MMRIVLVFICVIVLLMMAAPIAAQQNIRILDETDRLDAASIQEHAQPLMDRGASIAIYIKETDEDVFPLLENDGLAQDAVLQPDLIVVYVALDPQTATVIGGADWAGKLENRGEYFRETTLYSHLNAHDYNRVVNDILVRIEVSLQNGEASDDTRIRLMALGAACVGLIMGSMLQVSGLFK